MSEVVIFAPSPILTVTVEENPDGPDIHIHSGGQGTWQARMLQRLGVNVTICAVLSGEGGLVLRHLFEDSGVRIVGVDREARVSAYLHDRRGGQRVKVVETSGTPISRHHLDELYGLTLREGLSADLVILSGPASDKTLPSDVYRRLAADLHASGRKVVVDLAGSRLTAALAGGVDVAKVSDEELVADGRAADKSTTAIIAAMQQLRTEGADTAIVTRADEPVLMLSAEGLHEVSPPKLQAADSSGAGDSLTAGVAAALAEGGSLEDAIGLGAAAGALNVTRHGLGTGDPATIRKLSDLVTIRAIDGAGETSAWMSPDELAARIAEG